MKLKTSLAEAYKLTFCYPQLDLHKTDYDAYWKDKRKSGMGGLTPFQKARADWILHRLTPGSSVLDYGCGDGGMLMYFRDNAKVEMTGADISPHAIEFLRSQSVNAQLLGADSSDAVESLAVYDHIILCEVLEHMQNPELFLSLIQSKVRKSIFFSIPNSGYFPYRIRMLLGKSVMQWRLHPGEHLRFWTVSDLKWWLKELQLHDKTEFHLYEGIPVLSNFWGSLFAMGIVGEIKFK